MAAQQIGTNVTAEVTGTTLTLKIDISKEHGLSKSQKSITVGSTNGNVTVAGVTVGLNVYKKRT